MRYRFRAWLQGSRTHAALTGMWVMLGLAELTPANAQVITWHDGSLASANTTDCITLARERLIDVWVGWYGDTASPSPLNSVYYVHVIWGVVGNPCMGGAKVAPELSLPGGTTLAISATTPVKCWAIDFRALPAKSTEERTGCPQSPGLGPGGGYYLSIEPSGRIVANFTWFWMGIQVPVTSSRGGGVLTGRVSVFDGVTNQWVYPNVTLPTAVPDVVGLARGAAEQKIEASGLCARAIFHRCKRHGFGNLKALRPAAWQSPVPELA